MENIEIASRLRELADLLEIQGANPFRVRAYRNAVRTLGTLTRPVAEMVSEGEDLTELPGIGEDLSSHIRELTETGELELLEEVAREVPRELAVLTRLDGVGPAKVKKLWKELDIVTIEDLEAAASSGRVEALDGFGQKSVVKILQAIQDFRKRQGRFLRADAIQYLRPLLAHMSDATEVERLEVAGSYRRGVETVGDVDLLAVLVDGSTEATHREVMERFTGFEGVARVESAGATRGRVVLRSGLPIDLRILPPRSYGAALHYFTGSKEHNVEIRQLARSRNLRLSEYGVFRVSESEAGGQDEHQAEGRPGASQAADGDWIAGRTETEIFEAVGLPWIPPELREGRGEIEAARDGTLPELVTLDDLQGDLHMHSTWSDGKDDIEAMARACRDRGYAYMAITDHSQAVTVAGGLTPGRIRDQADQVNDVRERVKGIEILHGCEVDILKDGTLDLPDDVLEILDIVLVAVHSHLRLDQAAQTRRILRALAHPMVDILVHPTGRLLGRREPMDVDVEALLQSALEHGVAVEMNANPYRLDLHDGHLRRARELGVPVSVATDAHRVSQLGQAETGLAQARRGWLSSSDVLNCRSAKEFSAWLDRRRT